MHHLRLTSTDLTHIKTVHLAIAGELTTICQHPVRIPLAYSNPQPPCVTSSSWILSRTRCGNAREFAEYVAKAVQQGSLGYTQSVACIDAVIGAVATLLLSLIETFLLQFSMDVNATILGRCCYTVIIATGFWVCRHPTSDSAFFVVQCRCDMVYWGRLESQRWGC